MDVADWEQLTANHRNSLVFKHRNKKYGAYELRSNYNSRFFLAIIFVLLALTAWIVGERFIPSSKTGTTVVQSHDTLLLSLSTPPVDPLETIAESLAIEGDETESESEEVKKEEPKKKVETAVPVGQQGQIQSDKPEAKTGKGPSQAKDLGNKDGVTQADIEAENKRMMDNSEEAKKRAALRKELDARKAQRAQKEQAGQQPAKEQSKSSGQEGKNLVNWKLAGRTPHNDDPRQIPIPGYKCGRGVSGTITLRIKVNNEGRVTDATTIGDESAYNFCILQEAKDYAKKSRFNASSKFVQEGTIEYKFVAQ